jgi:hypothetical protein
MLARTKFGQVRYFFGNDKRGHLFSRWGLNPKAWTEPRKSDDRDLKELTNVQNYDKSTQTVNNPDAAHYEVGDLIALTGFFHGSVNGTNNTPSTPSTLGATGSGSGSGSGSGATVGSGSGSGSGSGATVATGASGSGSGSGATGATGATDSPLLLEGDQNRPLREEGDQNRPLLLTDSPLLLEDGALDQQGGGDKAVDYLKPVVKNWNDLDEFAKGFYRTFLSVKQGINPVPESGYHTVSDTATIKINAKEFIQALPNIKSNYTDDKGEIHVKNLRMIYYENYYPQKSEKYGRPQTSLGYFSLNMEDLIRKRLFALSTQTNEDLLGISDEGDAFDIYGNIWKHDSRGFFQMVDGERVNYGKDDKATMDLLRTNVKCYSTGLNTNKAAECDGYVLKCLLSDKPGDLNACLNYLKRSDLYDIAREEIKSMHPIIAYYTLRRFGFQVRNQFDRTAGQNLDKVMSVEEWTNSVLKDKPKAVSETIAGNSNLMKYLQYVVDYVNCNPAILNKNYGGKSNEGMGVVSTPKVAEDFDITMRIDPNPDQEPSYNLAMAANHLQTNLFNSGTGFSNVGALMGTIVSPQAGGGAAKEKLDSAEKTCGAAFLQGIVREAISSLKDNGKTLADSDVERLNKLLKNMKENEKKIKDTVRYMDEFTDLARALGDQSSKIITEANMKSLLNKNRQYISRNARDQLKLISVLSALRNMVSASGIDIPVNNGTGNLRPMGAV